MAVRWDAKDKEDAAYQAHYADNECYYYGDTIEIYVGETLVYSVTPEGIGTPPRTEERTGD